MFQVLEELQGLFHYQNLGSQFLAQKTKLVVDSSIMVSVSKDGYFQKHCTVEMGVAYHCSIQYYYVQLAWSCEPAKFFFISGNKGNCGWLTRLHYTEASAMEVLLIQDREQWPESGLTTDLRKPEKSG